MLHGSGIYFPEAVGNSDAWEKKRGLLNGAGFYNHKVN